MAFKKQEGLKWATVSPEKMTADQRKLYDACVAATKACTTSEVYKRMISAKKALVDKVQADAAEVLPATHTMLATYRYGKLSTAVARRYVGSATNGDMSIADLALLARGDVEASEA